MTRPAEPGGLADAVVVLAGTGEHPRGSGLRPVPAVGRTLADLKRVLVTRCGVAPGAVTIVDPADPAELGDALLDAVDRATGPLVFYYVGHGLVNDDGMLHLATRRTRLRADHTALPYGVVRRYLRDSPSAVRMVILDCCFAGRAIDVLGPAGAPLPATDIDGVCVLTSAGRDELALAPEGARHTVFSGAFVDLLDRGDPAGERYLTLDGAVRYLVDTMRSAEYPEPRYARTARVGELRLADNRAWGPGRTTGPDDERLPRARSAPRRVPLAGAVLGAALSVPVLTAVTRPDPGWKPAGPVGALLDSRWGWVLLAVAAALPAWWLTRLVLRRWPAGGPGRRRAGTLAWWWPRVTPPVLALLLGSAGLSTGALVQVGLAGCPPAVQVTVLTTADGYEPTRELRTAFERATRQFGCPAVRLNVFAAAAREAAGELRAGWPGDAPVRLGPRPDIWLPDSSTYLADGLQPAPVAELIPSIASSPLVLAYGSDRLTARQPDLVPPQEGETLAGLRARLRSLKLDLVLAAPDTSAVGELSRLPFYRDGRLDATALERDLDRARQRFGVPAGADAAQLLCRYRDVPDSNVAILVPEQAVARFNDMRPIGAACPGATRFSTVDDLGRAYPRVTGVLDHPLVRFGWPDLSARQRDGARRFTDWVAGPDGGRALRDTGLRPRVTGDGGAVTGDPGKQPGVRFDAARPDPGLRGKMLTAYRTARRPGRVLLLLDASGSMGRGQPRRWDLAAQAAGAAAARMGPGDELGVWAFHGEGAAGIRRLVPVGGADVPVRGRDRGAAVGVALRGYPVGGRTPLYEAVSRGIAAVGPATAGRVTAVVLLTDGEDDNASRLTRAQLQAAVRRRGVQVWVVALGDARCTARALQSLPAGTAGRCLEAPGSMAAAVLAGALDALWVGERGR